MLFGLFKLISQIQGYQQDKIRNLTIFYGWLIVCCLALSEQYFRHSWREQGHLVLLLLKIYKLFVFPIFRLDEGYSRNVSCGLNLISTFLLQFKIEGRDGMVVGFTPLMWVRIAIMARCTTVCQWLMTGWGVFSRYSCFIHQ